MTILYTVLTGSILIILLAFISYRNISLREQQQETDFHNLWFSVSSRLQSFRPKTTGVISATVHIMR